MARICFIAYTECCMTKKLRVSLVLPAYNEEEYLAACLDAISKQTIQPYEVIVVDNNSSDGTADIASSYDFVRLIHETKQGIVYARDAGFNAARGEIIARIDADTILTPDWVEKIAISFENEETIAITGRAYFSEVFAGRLVGAMQVFAYQILQRFISHTYTLWGSNMALRRSVWLQVSKKCSKNILLDEDIDLTLCLQSQNYHIIYRPDLVVYASFRRGDLSLGAVIRYMSSWPRNYHFHGRFFEAFAITALQWSVILTTLPFSIYYSVRKMINRFFFFRKMIIDKILQY